MVASPVNQSRRAALFGSTFARTGPTRPPWTDEERVAEACTRCGDCITACPENVLKTGQGGFPEFTPNEGTGMCTFCGACADACAASVFDLGREVPWSLTVSIESSACLAHAGIHCSSCREACDENAIRMEPRIGGPSLPLITETKCTGCGACVGICPGQAVSLRNPQNLEMTG